LEEAAINTNAPLKIWNNNPLGKHLYEARALRTHPSTSEAHKTIATNGRKHCSTSESSNSENGSIERVMRSSPTESMEEEKDSSSEFYDEQDPLEREWLEIESKEKQLLEKKTKLESIRKAKELQARQEFKKVTEQLRDLTFNEVEFEGSVQRNEESYKNIKRKSTAAKQELEKCLAALVKKESRLEAAREKLLEARVQIQGLKTKKAQLEEALQRLATPESRSENTDKPCPICYGSSSQCNRRALQCGHVYCADCIDRIQNDASKERRICPICRSPISFVVTLFT
jgi:DNA repair exonuclease SbcCD ATPase subunit